MAQPEKPVKDYFKLFCFAEGNQQLSSENKWYCGPNRAGISAVIAAPEMNRDAGACGRGEEPCGRVKLYIARRVQARARHGTVWAGRKKQIGDLDAGAGAYGQAWAGTGRHCELYRKSTARARVRGTYRSENLSHACA